jgi:hypothetical protein
MHMLSRQIVNCCIDNEVGVLRWKVDDTAPKLPWAWLRALVTYKADEIGIRALDLQQDRRAVSGMLPGVRNITVQSPVGPGAR